LAVINIDTIGYKDAVQIELGSTSIKEKFEKFKDSSINMGRRVVVAGSMAESGTVRQTEAYYGYTKTLRPAAPIIQSGAAIMATMSAIQITREYKQFNKKYGTEIQNYIHNLPKDTNGNNIIAKVDYKEKIKKNPIINEVSTADKNGNISRNKVVSEVQKTRIKMKQRPIVIEDWKTQSLFTSKTLKNNINIATTHSRIKLKSDGTIHCYRHNPARARKEAIKLEKELTRRKDIAKLDMDAIHVKRLFFINYTKDSNGKFHTTLYIRSLIKESERIKIDKEKRTALHGKRADNYEALKKLNDRLKCKLYRKNVNKEYDCTNASLRLDEKIRKERYLEKNVGDKLKTLNVKEGAKITNGDMLIQIAGRKAMAAQGARKMAHVKRWRSLRKAQRSLLQSSGFYRNNDFGEGYQVFKKSAMVTKPVVNRMTLKVIYKTTKRTGRIAGKFAIKGATNVIATGIQYRYYRKGIQDGTFVVGKNLKTNIALLNKNRREAKKVASQTVKKTLEPINNLRTIKKKTQEKLIAGVKTNVSKVTNLITKPFRNFMNKVLTKFNNTAVGKGVNFVGKIFGKIIAVPFKGLMSIFRGVSAIFSAIGSFLFAVAFGYVLIYAAIIGSGSLLSGVFGIFDSIAQGASEIWANTEPNVNYAVDEIQEASRELTKDTQTMQNLAVISSVIDKLPTRQLWRKLKKEEFEECAGYDITLIGDTDQYILNYPSGDGTVNQVTIPLKKNKNNMVQENDREILSIITNLYEYYGGISNTFNIGKQIEKNKWRDLVQELYILSHSAEMDKEPFEVEDYTINYWTGEKTVTNRRTYYKWKIYVEILRGNDFFNKCGQVALERGLEIDPDIEVRTLDELFDYYIASMEKNELWDEDSGIKYKDYEFSYFDNTNGILAQIANFAKVTPQSQYTYDYSNPPENVLIVDSNDDSNSIEYVRIVEKEDGTYDTTGSTFVVSNGSISISTVFTENSKKEQEYIKQYLEENGIEEKKDSGNSSSNSSNNSSNATNSNSNSSSTTKSSNDTKSTNNSSNKAKESSSSSSSSSSTKNTNKNGSGSNRKEKIN